MPPVEYEQLIERMSEIQDLSGAASMLSWDLETYLPPKGLGRRARQLSTLSGLIHSKATDPEVGRLLDALERAPASESLGETERAVVSETRHDFERACKLPEDLVRDLARTTSLATESWRRARAESNFALFADPLKKIVDLLRRKAEAYGYEQAPYDALIEDYERGMTAEKIRPIFDGLRQNLSGLVKNLSERGQAPSPELVEKSYDSSRQWDFSLRILDEMGFDLEAGRLDRSAHPFTSGTHCGDVRLTTRIAENDIASGLFSTMHEGGHGIYEQGFHPDHQDTILAQAPSLGLHESQSRMWENQIGRGLPFWRRYFPQLQELFPENLTGASAEDFYRAINRVEPSFIRVEADEATYPLHIILRFEIEIGLIDGSVEVDSLPDLWNAKMKDLLGIEPPDDARGVLQDVHWSQALVGYFPTYALGNLYAAQIFEVMRRELGDVDGLIEGGQMREIRDWLNIKIHHAGRSKTASQTIHSVCGEGLNPQPFLDYTKQKFGAIYGVDL